MVNYWKNTIKLGNKLIMPSKKNLIVIQNTIRYLRPKIKLDNGKIKTNFQNNKIPIEVTRFISHSVISIDSNFRTCKNYYP